MELSKISGTLEKGRFYSGGLLKFLYFSTIICALVVPLAIAAGIANIKTEGVANVIVIIIMASVLFGGVAAIFLYIIKKNENLKKEIKIYLQDAVLLEAQTKDVGSLSVYRRFYDGTKIRVSFRYNGKVITKESGNPKKIGRINNGYDKVFWKYINRTINILYSPQYEQVMFLKD